MSATALQSPYLETLLACLLRRGTWLASAVTAVGLALLLSGSLGAAGPAALAGVRIATAGIALFILLPVLRLALMLLVFLRERDYLFGMIAALVLAIIALGTVLGTALPVHRL